MKVVPSWSFILVLENEKLYQLGEKNGEKHRSHDC